MLHLALASLLFQAPASQAALGYRLVVASPMATTVHVEIDLPDLPPPQVLVIPRAVPMGYGEEPYDRFVSNVKAFAADGKPLDVARGEGPRFVMNGSGPVRRVAYDVDVARMEREVLEGSDSSRKRPGYLGLLGYSIFGTIEGLEDRPVTLRVRAPNNWPVFSTLSPTQPRIRKFTAGNAPNYHALADSQLAMGPALRVRRLVGSPVLFVVAYVEGDFDIDVFARMSREALDADIDYFACVPFPHYSVMVEAVKPLSADHRYGFSMEHLESTSMTFASDAVPTAASTEAENERFFFNLAHHVAHAWIPKRSYGTGYYPFSWEVAPVLDTIWFSEGFAQYVALSALAAHRPDGAAYRERVLSQRFKKFLDEAPPFLARLSTVELSRVASTRYSSDFRTGKSSFSRGALMAAEMDDKIRSETYGGKSLRDALRYLVDWSAVERRGFTTDELPDILSRGAGVDLRDVYEKWMRPQAR